MGSEFAGPLHLPGGSTADLPDLDLGPDFPLKQSEPEDNILQSSEIGGDWRSGRRLTSSQNAAMKAFGLSKRAFNKIIHNVKQQIEGNPDMEFDLDTGEIFDGRSGEWIGNLNEYWD